MDEGIIKDVGALEVEAEHLKEGQEDLKNVTANLEMSRKWNDESIDLLFKQINELTDRVTLLEIDADDMEENGDVVPAETVPAETVPTETVIETMEKEAPKKERKYIFGII